MRFYAFLSLIGFFTFFVVGLYVYLGNPKAPVNKSYFYFSIVLVVVSFSEFMMRGAFSTTGVEGWGMIHTFSSMYLGIYYLYFAVVWSRLFDIGKVKHIYFFAGAFAVGSINTFYGISGIVLEPAGYSYKIHSLLIYELCSGATWVSGLAGSLVVLYVYFTTSKRDEKRQALLISAAAWLPLLGTLLTILIFPISGILFPKLVSIFFFFQFLLMGYAISEYSLFAVDPKLAARNIVNVMSSSLVTTDLSGKIFSANRPIRELLSYEERQLISKDVSIIFQDKNKFNEFVDSLDKDKKVIRDVEVVFIDSGGHPRPVLMSFSVLPDKKGAPAGYLIIARDIGRLKEAEMDLIKARDELELKVEERTAALADQTERLARSNSELEQFAYITSHDLQEPLRMIASYIKLLSKRYKGQLDQDADDFIGFAEDGAKRLKVLIDDLLAYSRITTRAKPFEPVDVDDVLEKVLKNLELAIEDSAGEVDHDPLPVIQSDPSQIMQLLQNLIGNALKFHKPGVRPKVHISAEDRGDRWLFSVRDNGIGIDPSFFDRIFLVFQRLHPREEYPGTGIGLAVCKKIVERHNGRIWVESEPDVGSTFYFEIPKEQHPIEPPAGEEPD